MADADTVIFQCGKCYTIIGDSTKFVIADEEKKTITLQAVSCIDVPTDVKYLKTSKDPADLGSTFFQCTCSNCNTNLGRVYKTTPRSLDALRDCFTLNTESILTYQVGTFTKEGIESESSNKVSLPSLKDYQRQEASLLKMQHLLLVFRDRLDVLEQQTSNAHTAPTVRDDSNGKRKISKTNQ